MSKPKYIQANYTRTIKFHLEELGIDWDQVKDFSVKYDNLTIYYKDGKEKSFANCSDCSEVECGVFDKNWDEIIEVKESKDA
tara:strand:- start:361 stop:606 length:246 start_codon:yes stop_codon:yes gene_type:complete